jgi:transposase
MHEVLVQLSLLSQGRTASWNSGGGGEGEHDDAIVNAVDRGLGRDEDPAGHYARRWDAAESAEERERVFDQAVGHLRSQAGAEAGAAGHAAPVESEEELHARIVDVGEGWTARSVADHFRCGIRIVWRARKAAGRDIELGKRPRRGGELSREERDAEIERLARDEDMSGLQIAEALQVSYSTVLRVLGTKRR